MKAFDHRSGAVLEVDGARLYYEVAGPADAPPLLFLHGGMGTMRDFDPVLERLTGSFRVIGLDSRGHGRSTLGREPLSYERLQRDVERVLAHLRIRRLSLVGFSDGGIVGYRLAAASPQLEIDKLVTIGAHGELPPGDPARATLAQVSADGWREKFPESYQRYQSLNPQPEFDRLTAAVVELWLDTSASGYPGALIEQVKAELLVVRGDDDHLFTREHALGVLRRVPSSKLFNIPFAGHSAFEDRPELFMPGLQRFLGR
jgi:valacyclovir hydrolase